MTAEVRYRLFDGHAAVGSPIVEKLFLFFALTLAQTAAASEIIIASDRGSVPVAVKIDRKADHVAVPLTVRAEVEQPDELMDTTTTAIAAIRAAFSADPDLQIRIGVVSLSPGQHHRKSSSSSTYGSVRASVQLLALSALTQESDVFRLTKTVHQGLRELDLPRDVSVSIGSTGLGISDPETHRGQLLEMIREQVRSTKEALGASGQVTIEGLQGPILAAQKNSSDVSLYIDYRIEITTQ